MISFSVAFVLVVLIIAMAFLASQWLNQRYKYRVKRMEQDHDIVTGGKDE